MATNRIRIQKQLEKSTTAGSIITTTVANEPSYLAPGTTGQVLLIDNTTLLPVWGGLRLVNPINVMSGALVTESHNMSTDSITFRNGLHHIVNGTSNEPMWGGNLIKNTTIWQTPNTGDGSPSGAGYNVTFDGQTGAILGSNSKFRVYNDCKVASSSKIVDIQTYHSGVNAAGAFIGNQIFHRWLGTGLAAQVIGGAKNDVVGNNAAGQLNNFTTGATFTANSEYKANYFGSNLGVNTGTAAFPSIVAFSSGIGGSGNASTVTVAQTVGCFINNQQGLGGITAANVVRHYDLHIREGSYSNNNIILYCGGTGYSNIYNSIGNVAPTAGNWGLYWATTRNNYIRGNTMFGGAAAVVPTFQLQLSTDSAGKPATALWTIVSDKRTKKDVAKVDSTNVLDLFKSLPNQITFKHNELIGESDDVNIGYLADDLDKLKFNTSVISKKKFDVGNKKSIELKTVNYHEIMMRSFEAIKQLINKVEYLESKLK